MNLRSRRIKMTEKTDSSSIFETPNSSLSCANQQDEDPVSHLMQRISKLEAIISKLLNITFESLDVTNIDCSLPNISTRMLTLEKMVHDRVQPSQFNEKEQSCVKLANPPPSQTSNKKKKKNKKRKTRLKDSKYEDRVKLLSLDSLCCRMVEGGMISPTAS